MDPRLVDRAALCTYAAQAVKPSTAIGGSAYYNYIVVRILTGSGASEQSTAEDHFAEADAGNGEIDGADRKHRDKRTPNKGDVGAAEQHRLGELHEMWRRADRLNEILQPDRHAFHRRGAPREQLRDHQHRHGEQAELAHRRR